MKTVNSIPECHGHRTIAAPEAAKRRHGVYEIPAGAPLGDRYTAGQDAERARIVAGLTRIAMDPATSIRDAGVIFRAMRETTGAVP